MHAVTTDRGALMHFAGFHHLSPALDAGGAPALSAQPGDGLARCGWERFFRAMGARRLALALAADDAGAARFTPAGGTSGAAGGGLSAAFARSARFWRALFPPRPGAAS